MKNLQILEYKNLNNLLKIKFFFNLPIEQVRLINHQNMVRLEHHFMLSMREFLIKLYLLEQK